LKQDELTANSSDGSAVVFSEVGDGLESGVNRAISHINST
jgi:hypothetical protein